MKWDEKRWDVLMQMRLRGCGVQVIQTVLQTGWGGNVISIFPLRDGTMELWTPGCRCCLWLQTEAGGWRSSNTVKNNKQTVISKFYSGRSWNHTHINTPMTRWPVESLCFLLIWRYGQTQVSGFWHPLETFTSSARWVHSFLFSPCFCQAPSFSPARLCFSSYSICSSGLATGGERHLFLSHFHTSWHLKYDGACRYPCSNVSGVWGVGGWRVEVGVTWCWKVCEHSCLPQTSDRNACFCGALYPGHHFINVFELFDSIRVCFDSWFPYLKRRCLPLIHEITAE